MTDPRLVEHNDELLSLLAVGVLEDGERAEIERHLSTCERCQEEFQALTEANEWLKGPVLRQPSPAAWGRIERALPPREAVRATTEPRQQPVAAASRWTRWAGLAAAFALVAAAGAGIALLLRERTDESTLDAIERVQTDDVVFTLAAIDPAAEAAGRIFMNTGRTEGVVAVTGLAQLPDGQRYAVWIVRSDDVRISAGTFTVDAAGSAVAALTIPELQYDWSKPGRYVALSISRVDTAELQTPVGGPILVGPLY